MNTQRYDIAAGRNVLNMLKSVSPGDYAQLMMQLKANAGLAGLGQTAAEESDPSWWEKLLGMGTNALTTIANYQLSEVVDKYGTPPSVQQQNEYQEAVALEMRRQMLLAEQARSQQMEYENQLALTRQAADLRRAADAAKSRLNWALIGVAGLLGLWVFTRMAT